jgi:hypothetical protein
LPLFQWDLLALLERERERERETGSIFELVQNSKVEIWFDFIKKKKYGK